MVMVYLRLFLILLFALHGHDVWAVTIPDIGSADTGELEAASQGMVDKLMGLIAAVRPFLIIGALVILIVLFKLGRLSWTTALQIIGGVIAFSYISEITTYFIG
jgi:hypothetical protein